MITKLFIGGLTRETDELALAKLIAPYGDMVTMKIVRDKMTRKSKGYAFIEMATRKEAEFVIDALDGKMIGDLELSVSIKEEEPPKPQFNSTYKRVERNAGGPVKAKRPRLQK